MENFFKILVIGVAIFLVIFLVAIGIAYGLSYINQWIPAEVVQYVTTGILFILAVFLAFAMIGDD